MNWTADFRRRNRVVREPLAGYTTFGIGGPAEIITLESATDLPELGDHAPRWLGRGANLLVADAGVDEPVVRLGRAFTGIDMATAASGDEPTVVAGCATGLPSVIAACAAQGLAGLEGFAGIPGTIGGALWMNAGSATVGIMDRLVAIELYDLAADAHRCVGRDELRPAYRDGGFTDGQVLLRAHLRLRRDDPVAVKTRADAARAAKAARQPLGERSAGCFFRNPSPERPAGRLLDELGCKGRRHGGAMVSPQHANFIINHAGATAADVLVLADELRAAVIAAHGITLASEVRCWNCGLTPREEA